MDTKIILSATWVVVTLIYLYGDVLRICSGDLAKKPMTGMNLNHRGRLLFPVQPGWPAHLFIIMGQIPDCSQHGVQWGHDLVCVELELSLIINSCLHRF
jgi:hypothetical protein